MSGETILLNGVIAAVAGLVLLAILWPVPRSGRRVLARWGVGDPGDEEVTDAVGYLKRRRIWYPWTFFGVSAAGSALGLSDVVPQLLGTLVAGALLAELWAQRPSRGDRRSALLVPRRLRDLVSPWSTGAFAVLFVVVVGTAVAALAGADWARSPEPWWALGGAVLVSAIGWGIAWLAVRRPAQGGTRVDEALRLRSARVAVGLTMASLGALYQPNTLGWLVFLAGLVCWIATVQGPPRTRARGSVRA